MMLSPASNISLNGKLKFPFEVSITMGDTVLVCDGDAWVLFTYKQPSDLTWKIERFVNMMMFDPNGLRVRIAPSKPMLAAIKAAIENLHYGEIEKEVNDVFKRTHLRPVPPLG